MGCILVHDLGTTGDKAALFSLKGELLASHTEPYPTRQLPGGGFEQNPADWLAAVACGTREVLRAARLRPADVAGISLSGHMMGVVALDGEHRPVRPAILHSDIRAGTHARRLRKGDLPDRVCRIAGNPLDAHYPWLKIAWLRDSEPESYRAARLFVQCKDYVTSWLTGREPVTDYSDASLYGCWDFRRMDWSDELCEVAGIDRLRLPQVVAAGERAGTLRPEAARTLGLPSGVPVFVGFGDGASAAVGAGAWEPGACYAYVGSTAWVARTASSPAIDPERRLFTLAIVPGLFSSIGTVQSAGAAWDWAVTRLCEAHFETAESLAAAAPPGSNGLLFLPYLAGERSPIWNDHARGVWFGLSSSHGVGDLLRSVLEGVSLALGGILCDICRCSEGAPGEIRLIGGGARVRLWRQILADCFARPCGVPDEVGEATSRGAYAAAAVGLEAIGGFHESARLVPPAHTVRPVAADSALYQAMRPLFEDLYSRLRTAYDDLARLRVRLRALEVTDAAV